MDVTPRMKPDAVTYPIGTRMNWVTWEPILPEDNFLETPDYGNGPGKTVPVFARPMNSNSKLELKVVLDI